METKRKKDRRLPAVAVVGIVWLVVVARKLVAVVRGTERKKEKFCKVLCC